MASPANTVQACPEWQRPAQSQKTGPTRRGEQDGDGPGCAPVNSSVLQGQARCEMADGRWQQGTPASVSTGWAGWWTGGARGGASKGKGTMKTNIACSNLYGVREMAYPSQPTCVLAYRVLRTRINRIDRNNRINRVLTHAADITLSRLGNFASPSLSLSLSLPFQSIWEQYVCDCECLVVSPAEHCQTMPF